MACFGLVCGTQNITVPRCSHRPRRHPLTATITADENLTITAQMADQHGNFKPGESILITPSNSVFGTTFFPYAAGDHTITVAHPASGQQVVVDITVLAWGPFVL